MTRKEISRASACSTTDVEQTGLALCWYLHIPIEKQFKSPGKIEKQVTTNEQTKVCSVDLNINENIAVCTIRTMDGSGWMSTRQIVLTNYGFSLSSGYATSSQEADYVAVSEAAVALAHAECHD